VDGYPAAVRIPVVTKPMDVFSSEKIIENFTQIIHDFERGSFTQALI
jgi:hypothetical protein